MRPPKNKPLQAEIIAQLVQPNNSNFSLTYLICYDIIVKCR